MTRFPSYLENACRLAAGFLIVPVLAGCLSMAPSYHRPPMPVSERYPEDAPMTASTSSRSEQSVDWHAVFIDADLQAAIETALHNNRDLRVSILRVAESRSVRGIDRANRLPSLNANAQGVRAGLPDNVGLTGFPSVLSAYQVTAAATWELDFWGRVRSLDTAAIEGYLATDAARRAFTVSLVAQVANTWLQQRELDQRIELARRSIATREESFRIFRRRYEEGSGTKLEVTQVETLLTQAQALASQLEQSRSANGHALSLLLGVPAAVGVQTGIFDGEEPVRMLSAGLPSQLLTSRPDIMSAEHRLKAAHANIGAARAAFFPQVTLTGNLGSASAELDGLFEPGSRTWSFLPAISVPLFAGGRLRASLDLAQVRREIAVADYESTVQGAFRDVADALSAQQWLNGQIAVKHRALLAARERSRLAQLRYDSGAATYLEILDAQRDLLSAEQALVEVQRALQSARVDLFAAVGAGVVGAGE